MRCILKPVVRYFAWSVILGGAALAWSATATAPATEDAPQDAPLKGTIVSLNYGGRGEVQGFMLGGGDKPVQINIPNEMADAIKALHTGDAVEVTPHAGGPGRGGPPGPAGRGPRDIAPDHEVFEAGSIKDAQGHTYKRLSPEAPGARSHVKVESTLRAINYDHRGVPDGIQLANGDLVHVGGAAAELKLTAKQAVVVEGEAETLPGGQRLIHATTLNGETIDNGPPGRGRGPQPAETEPATDGLP